MICIACYRSLESLLTQTASTGVVQTIPESVRNHRGLQNVENARSASGDAHFAWHYVRKVEQPDEMELYLHGRAGAGRVGFSYRHHYEYNKQDRAAP